MLQKSSPSFASFFYGHLRFDRGKDLTEACAVQLSFVSELETQDSKISRYERLLLARTQRVTSADTAILLRTVALPVN